MLYHAFHTLLMVAQLNAGIAHTEYQRSLFGWRKYKNGAHYYLSMEFERRLYDSYGLIMFLLEVVQAFF